MTIKASDPIPFGEWLPDLGEFNNPGALMVKNCVPRGQIYTPFGDALPSTDALGGICKGAFAYRDASGNVTQFAGTKTGLFKLDGTSWLDVTRLNGGGPSTLPYTTSDDGFWDFVNFGTLVIATNYNDDIQVYDVGSDTEFSELSATAPRCRRFFILNNFLVTIDTVDSDGSIGYRVRWSPLNNPAGDWTSDPTGTQADFQDIYGGDFANAFGAALQDCGVIVQGKTLWRMDYVGGDKVFSFNKIDTGRGSILPRACISNGRSAFFPSEDGFYEYNGAELIPIGDKKVDKYFYRNFNETYDYNMNVAIDPLKKNVLWAFPSTDTTEGMCDLIMCFNWVDRRWTLIEEETEILFSFLSVGYTMDGLDALYATVDEIPFSLDSRIWTGGKTVLGCFTGEHKMAAFSGSIKTATIGTPELRINNSGRATIYNLIPYIEGDPTITGRLGRRNKVNTSVDWTAYVSQSEVTGELNFLHDAVFFRAELQISGDWEYANAVAVRAKNTGGN